MITDQNQTGVPSATKGRLQLIKPVQTANSGLTSGAPQLKNPVSSSANATSINYNPIKANTPNPLKAPSSVPTPQITQPVKPETDEWGRSAKYGVGTGITDPKTGEELFYNDNYLGEKTIATPSYQDMLTEAGSIFSKLPVAERLQFLKNVEQGIYDSLPNNKAVMTGDQYIVNSKQDQYK